MRTKTIAFFIAVILLGISGCETNRVEDNQLSASLDQEQSEEGQAESILEDDLWRSVTQGADGIWPEPQEHQVLIVVESNENSAAFMVDDVKEGQTVEELMRQVTALGAVINGSGATAFVNRIGNRETGLREGWTYKVDGEFAKRGVGQMSLNPPSIIQWTYGTMQPESL